MWVFTKYGFYSAVSPRGDSGEVDTDKIMIRSRLKGHLDQLRKRFPIFLKGAKVQKTDDADYRYRVIIHKALWAELLAQLGDEIEYSNFKGEVAAFGGRDAYEKSLHQIWQVMWNLQQTGDK
jgi:hypothetical protein